MNSLIQKHRSIIRQIHKMETTQDMKGLLNETIVFLNSTTHNQIDGFQFLTFICYEMAGLTKLKIFNNSEIINHQFFIILNRTFEMFLTKLIFISLTKQEEQCIDGMTLLINNLCLYKNNRSICFYIDNSDELNLISYEEIFLTKVFMKKFVNIIENDITVHEYEPYDIKYKIIDRLLRLCIKLNNIDRHLILDSIVKCIESKIYLDLYKTVDLHQLTLNPKQLLFMYQCPKFIRLCSHSGRQEEISYSLSKSIIKYSADIFQIHLSTIVKRDRTLTNQVGDDVKIPVIGWYIQLLNHLALTPTTREFFIKSKLKQLLISDCERREKLKPEISRKQQN